MLIQNFFRQSDVNHMHSDLKGIHEANSQDFPNFSFLTYICHTNSNEKVFHSLSLTTPPFMKTTLRITNRSPVFGLAALQQTLTNVGSMELKHLKTSSETQWHHSGPDQRYWLEGRGSFCCHQLINQYVHVIFGVNFNQFQTKYLIETEENSNSL